MAKRYVLGRPRAIEARGFAQEFGGVFKLGGGLGGAGLDGGSGRRQSGRHRGGVAQDVCKGCVQRNVRKKM